MKIEKYSSAGTGDSCRSSSFWETVLEARERKVRHRRGRLRHQSVQTVRNIQDVRREPNAMRDLIVRTAASAR